ncbi:MAG: hypothetical protein ACTS2F_06465 [Thainema sp.]
MKSPVNFDIQMPNLNAPSPAAPSSTAASDASGSAASKYAPSVPISVYRELAAELQNTKGKLDTLNGQNQQLVQQNQRLRQEIQKLAQSAVQTQQVVEALPAIRFDPARMSAQTALDFDLPLDAEPTATSVAEARPAAASPARKKVAKGNSPSGKRPANGKAPKSGKAPEVYVIEQEDKRPVQSSPKKASDMGGLWLAIAIILIIVSAFGAGFLIVRPFLSDSAPE